ncbi:MAG: hypothetical protein ACI4KA_00440 [Oscillospiraceae bacterium]
MGAFKFGFKKEWYHFSRTFRFGGILIALISVALVNPLMIKSLSYMMDTMMSMAEPMLSELSGEEIAELSTEYTSPIVFSAALSDFCNTALLVLLLVLMSPFGGEQKKRATLIPSCSGLDNEYYLIPKFVLYPAVIFAATIVSGMIAGGLSNALFPEPIGFGTILLGSLLCAIYLTFIMTIYMALGLCTSRPGIMTIAVYFGHSLVSAILLAMNLEKFNPFTLYYIFSHGMNEKDFSLAKEVPSIIVGALLAVVISVMMYFLTLAVLRTKRINNQEDKPEF